jgi:hypothetical protein
VSRFYYALPGALALHGLLLLAHARHVPAARARAVHEQLVELEAPEVVEDPPNAVPVSSEPQIASRSAGALPAAIALRDALGARSPRAESESRAPAGDDAASGNGAAGTAEPTPEASAEPAPRKIDLGLDGHFFMRAPSEEFPRVRKPEVQRQLEAALVASDVAHGLARGNALLGSLNAAVRDVGPVRGEALFCVIVGADGSMTGLEFLQGSASDWSAALQSFRELAARKHVRVPPGARGLRVTFKVKAKVQMPSGQEVKGVDVASPSFAPKGLLLHGTFDVADVGAGAQRLVYAHVVSEEVL